MALADLYFSPGGAGDNSGSSVANAIPAVDGSGWSSDIEGEDRANKRWIFLAGTYSVNNNLVFTAADPTITEPHQWVGADASGNILRPKFDETGLRLVTTDYPKIVMAANAEIMSVDEYMHFKCLSFENTHNGYSQTSIIDNSTADIDSQIWVGCNFKTKAGDTAAQVMIVSNNQFHDCVFEMIPSTASVPGPAAYDTVVLLKTNGKIDNCRVIGAYGPGIAGSLSGDGGGIYTQALNAKIRNCVVTNCHGHGVHLDSSSNKADIDVAYCTIVNTRGDGINTANQTLGVGSKGSMEGCIIYGHTGNGIETNADDSRQGGAQILAMGGNGANFLNMDSYEDMIDVITITEADFIDYDNMDYRIRRTSPLYKFYGTKNFGAIQNEDYEFVSVS